MSSEATTLEILIDIRSQLDGLNQAANGIRSIGEETAKASKESDGLWGALKEGLSIGSGISVATKGIEMLKEGLKETVGEAIRSAQEIKDAAANIGIDTDPYQVLRVVVKETGGDVNALTGALNTQQRQLVAAAADVGGTAAAAYAKLGLSVSRLQGMTLDRQFESVARSIVTAGNKQDAFSAAAVILGERNIPRLREALRSLGEEGYDTLAQKAQTSIISPEAIARLSAAAESIKTAKDQLVAKIAEDLASMLAFFGQPAPETPEPRVLTPQQLADAANLIDKRNQLQAATQKLAETERGLAEVGADPTTVDSQKAFLTTSFLTQQISLLKQIMALKLAIPPDPSKGETPEKNAAVISQLEDQIRTLEGQLRGRTGSAPTEFKQSRDQFNQFNNPTVAGSTARDPSLTVGEGSKAGAMDWVSDLGSQGKQVASSLRSTIGGAVTDIGDGIWGWITATESAGQALWQLESTVFKSIINTLVQMGVQWLINTILIKTGMIGIEATGDTLRSGRVIKENAATASTLPLKTADAAATGIGSYGLALIFGALAVAMILGAMGAFYTGGYTGPGGKYDVRGSVHAGEIVWSQDDISRAGGVQAVENARLAGGFTNQPGVSIPGQSSSFSSMSTSNTRSVVGPGGSMSSALASPGRSAGAGGSAKSQPVAVFDNRDTMRTWVDDRGGDAVIAETANQNSYRIRRGR